MPAEWHPHAATWMAWPNDDEQWVGMLEPVRREFTAFVEAIAAREPVNLLLADADSEQDARRRLTRGSIRFHHVAHQDLWLRDSGPTFVMRGDLVALVDWEFWRMGDPAEDIAYLAELNRLPDPVLAAVLDGYASPGVAAAVGDWRALTALDAGGWYLREGMEAESRPLLERGAELLA